jgi:DNA-binding Lrp family transcriptional regulator
VEIDEKNMELLEELEKNCKQKLKKLARKIGLSISSTYERIKKLESDGVIRSYKAILDYEKIGYDLPAIIEIVAQREKQFEIANKLIKFKNVFAIYGITGDKDMIIVTRFRNREELSNFINNLFQMEGIEKTSTHVVLNELRR